MQYTSYKELEGNKVFEGDKIVFTVGDKQYNYTVRHCFLLCSLGDNETIFKALELDKEAFCNESYGYTSGSGDCPTCKERDWSALTRLVLALFKEAEKKNKAEATPYIKPKFNILPK